MSRKKENESHDTTNDDSTNEPDPNLKDSSIAVETAVNEAIASECTESKMNCAGTVSYIHVYKHSASCSIDTANSAHAGNCYSNDSISGNNKNDLNLELPSFSTVFSPVKNLLNKMHSVIPAGKTTKSADKVESRSTDDEFTQYANSEKKDPESSSFESNLESEWDDDIPQPPKNRKVWQGASGLSVLTFGVLAPLLISGMGLLTCPKRITLVLLNHPIETLVELAMLALIPIVNYKIWESICKNNVRLSLKNGLALGTTIATGLAVSGLCFAAIPAAYSEMQQYTGADFTTGFFFIGVLALSAAITGFHLMNRIRQTRDFKSTKFRVVAYTMAGILCGLAIFSICEMRSWTVRVAEQMALSTNSTERNKGLELLRNLKAEKELRMDCSDSRAAGIAGLFIPVKRSMLPELYFNVTGKAFHDENSKDFSSMPDWYLKRHVVGAPVKGLTLVRSALDGQLSPDSLSSTLNWTFVFQNNSSNSQEARAELALPPGAIVNGLTVFKDGEPINAGFFAASNENNSNWINGGSTTPAIVRDLGKGRHLFHCYPVTQDEQLKVSIKIVVPLRMESLAKTKLTLPRFLATNFSFDGENTLNLVSPKEMVSRSKHTSLNKDVSGKFILSGTLKKSQLDHTPFVITAHRDPSINKIAASDIIYAWIKNEDKKREEEAKARIEERQRQLERQYASEEPKLVVTIDGSRGVKEQIEGLKTLLNKKVKKVKIKKKKKEQLEPKWVVRTIEEVVTDSPKKLLIVLDGSAELGKHIAQIKNALKTIPKSKNVYLSVASSEDKTLSKPTKLSSALDKLDKVKFLGGQENLKSVVHAAEKASATNGGAVLWIHGPQPTLSKDIYIMSPFGFRPTFFELSLDDGVTDTVEYFKNHGEVGPFMPIQTTANLSSDLEDFFGSWLNGRKTYKVSYQLQDKKPGDALEVKGRSQRELRTMNARDLVYNKIKANKSKRASLLAVAYKLVSPVSCASMIKRSGQPMLDFYQSNNIENEIANGAAPILQGATNGTIGPQGADATMIMGVNTAGTVRVNNLANLEALLNIISNLAELAGMLVGAILILHGFVIRQSVASFMGIRAKLSPGVRIAIGLAIIVIALMVPDLVNWFVASARDANMFS